MKLPRGHLVAILIILTSGCNSEKIKKTLCRDEVEMILDQIETYASESGSPPSEVEGLKLLMDKGYIGGFLDPWGDPYKYSVSKLDSESVEISISSRFKQSRVLKVIPRVPSVNVGGP